MREQGGEAINLARERGEEIYDTTEKTVRKHPIASIGIALLVGAVIGALVFRNRH